METTNTRTGASGVVGTREGYGAALGNRESFGSAVSWAAIIGGAFVAAALALILTMAGTGLGFSSMSPWGDSGASAMTLGIAAIVWLLVVQILSSGMGGYIAGRLRTKWVDTHSDEVFFRDTAHGFIVWALGAVITAVMVGSVASSLISGTAKVAGTAAGGATAAATAAVGSAAGNAPSSDYLVDTLLRSDRPDATGNRADARTEVGRILTTSISRGDMTPEDKAYVSKVVAQQAGVDQATADKRVNDMVEGAKASAARAKQTALEAADASRKAAAAFSLWAFISMLVGAFSSSYAATLGGRARDRHN